MNHRNTIDYTKVCKGKESLVYPAYYDVNTCLTTNTNKPSKEGMR